jgi:hypothetical protein
MKIDTKAQSSIVSNSDQNFDYYPLKRLNNKYSHSRADWIKFKGIIEKSFSNIDFKIISTIEELDKKVAEITEIIHSAIDQIIPIKKNFQKSAYWWTSQISDKRKIVNPLRRKYQKSKDPIVRNTNKIYYAKKKNYQNLILKSKRQNWRNFCSESNVWNCPQDSIR